MDKEIHINIDHLIGSIHVSTHPSLEKNHQFQHLANEVTDLGYKLSGVILKYLQSALDLPEIKEILERLSQMADYQKPHQHTQDTDHSSSLSLKEDE